MVWYCTFCSMSVSQPFRLISKLKLPPTLVVLLSYTIISVHHIPFFLRTSSNFPFFNCATKRPHTDPTDSPLSLALLQKTMPRLISSQHTPLSSPHLQCTEAKPKFCSLPSQSPSTFSRKQIPLLTFRMSLELWENPVSMLGCSRQESKSWRTVAS